MADHGKPLTKLTRDTDFIDIANAWNVGKFEELLKTSTLKTRLKQIGTRVA